MQAEQNCALLTHHCKDHKMAGMNIAECPAQKPGQTCGNKVMYTFQPHHISKYERQTTKEFNS
jgi:hypothetical protein